MQCNSLLFNASIWSKPSNPSLPLSSCCHLVPYLCCSPAEHHHLNTVYSDVAHSRSAALPWLRHCSLEPPDRSGSMCCRWGKGGLEQPRMNSKRVTYMAIGFESLPCSNNLIKVDKSEHAPPEPYHYTYLVVNMLLSPPSHTTLQ